MKEESSSETSILLLTSRGITSRGRSWLGRGIHALIVPPRPLIIVVINAAFAERLVRRLRRRLAAVVCASRDVIRVVEARGLGRCRGDVLVPSPLPGEFCPRRAPNRRQKEDEDGERRSHLAHTDYGNH